MIPIAASTYTGSKSHRNSNRQKAVKYENRSSGNTDLNAMNSCTPITLWGHHLGNARLPDR